MVHETGPETVLVLQRAGVADWQAGRAAEVLRSRGFPVRVCTDCGRKDDAPFGSDAAEPLLSGVTLVLIAAIPLHQLDCILRLDDSDPLACLVILSLCRGLPVFALLPGVDPRRRFAQPGACADGMGRRLDRLFSDLAGLGIRFAEKAEDITQKPAEEPRGRLVTMRDLELAREQGLELCLRPQDRLTPLAADALAAAKEKKRRTSAGGETL